MAVWPHKLFFWGGGGVAYLRGQLVGTHTKGATNEGYTSLWGGPAGQIACGVRGALLLVLLVLKKRPVFPPDPGLILP